MGKRSSKAFFVNAGIAIVGMIVLLFGPVYVAGLIFSPDDDWTRWRNLSVIIYALVFYILFKNYDDDKA